MIKPLGFQDFTRDLERKGYENERKLLETINRFINGGPRPLLPVNVETHYTGEGEFFFRLWYREGWER